MVFSYKQKSTEHEFNSVAKKSEDSQEYYEAAIGNKNTDFYLAHFNRFDLQGFGPSWNWPSFFVSIFWLLYRKMWVWALLYLLLGIMCMFSVFFIDVYTVYQAATFIVFPMFANALYHRHVNKKILKVKNYTDVKEKRLRIIAAEGGTSGAVLTIPLYLFIAPLGIVIAVAIPAYQDYVTRTNVMEGWYIGEEYKSRVENYAIQNQEWPQSSADIGRIQQNSSSNIRSVSIVENGVVIITYDGDSQLEGKSIAFVPSINNENDIVWKCKGNDIEQKYLPQNCR